MRLYVDHISQSVSVDELRKEFIAFGEVDSVRIVTEWYSGRSNGGFAFIQMASSSAGHAAITGLNGKILQMRALRVSQVRDLSERPETSSFQTKNVDLSKRKWGRH